MIKSLRGQVIEVNDASLVLDVNGVGYEVLTTPLVQQSSAPGSDCFIHTYHLIREDAQELYGFLSQVERNVFQLIIRVSRVGPRLALSLLSTLSVEELAACIASEDVKSICTTPGIGPRLAEQIILELRNKLDETVGTTAVSSGGITAAMEDAEEALIALGYRTNEVRRAVREIEHGDMEASDLIRSALKRLALQP